MGRLREVADANGRRYFRSLAQFYKASLAISESKVLEIDDPKERRDEWRKLRAEMMRWAA